MLYGEMMGYLKEVGARIPKPNFDCDTDNYKQPTEYADRVLWGKFEGHRPFEGDE